MCITVVFICYVSKLYFQKLKAQIQTKMSLKVQMNTWYAKSTMATKTKICMCRFQLSLR